MIIESIIAKLHVAPNPNSKVVNNEIDKIIDILFLKEFGHFQNKSGTYGLRQDMIFLLDALNGNLFLWH